MADHLRLHIDDLAGHILKTNGTGKGGWTHLDLPAVADRPMSVPIGLDQTPQRYTDDLLQPVPLGGKMVRWSWFPTYETIPDQKGSYAQIAQSWDTASKATELPDYYVGITAKVTRDTIYILDVVRARLEYPELKKRVLAEKARWKATDILIEEKGFGMSLIQDLKREFMNVIPVKPVNDMIVRLSVCTAKIEAGAVYLPNRAHWLDDFRDELIAFLN